VAWPWRELTERGGLGRGARRGRPPDRGGGEAASRGAVAVAAAMRSPAAPRDPNPGESPESAVGAVHEPLIARRTPLTVGPYAPVPMDMILPIRSWRMACALVPTRHHQVWNGRGHRDHWLPGPGQTSPPPNGYPAPVLPRPITAYPKPTTQSFRGIEESVRGGQLGHGRDESLPYSPRTSSSFLAPASSWSAAVGSSAARLGPRPASPVSRRRSG